MRTSHTVGTTASPADAPITLGEPPARTLGLRDTAGLWANLGISLLLPVAAVHVVANGWSASLGSLAIAAVLTVAVALPEALRYRRSTRGKASPA
jgi:NCS1 family nucleobase:cation symporter-1